LSPRDTAFSPARGPIAIEQPRAAFGKRAAARSFNFIERYVRNCTGYQAGSVPYLCNQEADPKRVRTCRIWDVMTEILITLFRFSVTVLALAAKGNPGGIVQQQIETMGLRQWLSLVSAWLVESVYAEIATLRDFSAAAFDQKPVKIAAPRTPIYLF
jgi:hypothetical protein